MLKTVGNPSTRSGDQTILDGNLIVGTSGKGVDFSANSHAAGMTSELLHDYEEGTFTPVVVGTGSAGAGTYFTQKGRYTKIGRLVFVEINLGWSAHTGTGDMQVSGLPFQPNADTVSQLSTGTYDLSLSPGVTDILLARVQGAQNAIVLLRSPVGGGAWNSVAMDTYVTALEISGCYTI